jgi:2-oxoglutarate ferredoxin oxidoreductase subunit beta
MEMDTYAKNTWCPGCGDFFIQAAFKSAVNELVATGQIELKNLVVSAGIGCFGKLMDYLKLNSFYAIHGRVPPVLTGIKLANPKLITIGFAGDGDAYDEGLDHLVHAAKRNSDIKMIIHNNGVFALTTGQTTATTPRGFKTKSTPKGSFEQPINPIALMLVSGATFVARGFAGNVQHLKELFKQAILHKGFAFIDVLQPCVTFNNTFPLYREKCYELVDHDVKNFDAALKLAYQTDKIPIGLFYKVDMPTFEEQLVTEKPKIEKDKYV